MAQLDRITINPNVCLGQPTIRGMRITVGFVLKLLASNLSVQEVLAAYPELEDEDIRQALTANCYQTWNKNPTPNPLPASDEGARMYLI
ncbi:MAG: DUF433 domain-containing protein [Aphanizomenon gracile PMC627.10]|nr:DUF433 domain-containing protein [Aphanizomenon gracile PMC627.10]